MKKKSLSRIIWIYVTLIVTTVFALIFWVLYVVDAYQTINELAIRMGGSPGGYYHWIVLAFGCMLLIFIIVGLSLQLASNISDYRYTRKQQEFVSNITHELKSPLAAIKLHGQTLKQGGLTTEESENFLTHILQQADRMTSLVEDVLEISRIRTKGAESHCEPLSLDSFFETYLAETRMRIGHHNIQIQDKVNTNVSIMGSSLGLHRILDNLINNAVKASQDGGVIGFEVTDGSKYVEIAVWDQGVGIHKKELPKIFKRFYQIGSEISGRRKGTGLGLAIVKGLVQEMKGRIRVESKGEQRGAKFTIRFPIFK